MRNKTLRINNPISHPKKFVRKANKAQKELKKENYKMHQLINQV